MDPDLTNSSAKDVKDDQLWSSDVEDAFREALEKFPDCGRRKILWNGHQYGRNELIAFYIKKKTGKTRTRKHVSSHIQVLTRKKEKLKNAVNSRKTPEKLHKSNISPVEQPETSTINKICLKTISTPKLALKTYTAYGSHTNGEKTIILDIRKTWETSNDIIKNFSYKDIANKFPPKLFEWLNSNPSDRFFMALCKCNFAGIPPLESFENFRIDTLFESTYKMDISMRTIISSFGSVVTDKLETCNSIEEFHEPQPQCSRYVYEMLQTQITMFSVNLSCHLSKIQQERERDLVNAILANYSVILLVQDRKTMEILMVITLLLENCSEHQEPYSDIYRLT